MTAIVALLILGSVTSTSGSTRAEVVIDAGTLQPLVLTVPVGQPVVFVNRSQRHAHVEFTGASREHTTLRVNGRTWAMILRPGLHSYVVSLGAPNARHLHGVIRAVEREDTSSGLPTCDAIPAIAICLER